MCGDPNCKYITLIEDEEGAKSAYHYGLSEETNDMYLIWVDYWQQNKQFKSHQLRKQNKTKKNRLLKNKVIRLGF
jgi:hypothetical protein